MGWCCSNGGRRSARAVGEAGSGWCLLFVFVAAGAAPSGDVFRAGQFSLTGGCRPKGHQQLREIGIDFSEREIIRTGLVVNISVFMGHTERRTHIPEAPFSEPNFRMPKAVNGEFASLP